MKRWDITTVNWGSSLDIMTTDPNLGYWVFGQLETFLRGCEWNEVADVDGETVSVSLKLKETGEQDPYPLMGWWLIKRLCHAGWEPYSVDAGTYYLRRAAEGR